MCVRVSVCVCSGSIKRAAIIWKGLIASIFRKDSDAGANHKLLQTPTMRQIVGFESGRDCFLVFWFHLQGVYNFNTFEGKCCYLVRQQIIKKCYPHLKYKPKNKNNFDFCPFNLTSISFHCVGVVTNDNDGHNGSDEWLGVCMTHLWQQRAERRKVIEARGTSRTSQ